MPMAAYEVNRRYADRVTDLLSTEYGLDAAIGWRDRLIAQARRCCLDALLPQSELA